MGVVDTARGMVKYLQSQREGRRATPRAKGREIGRPRPQSRRAEIRSVSSFARRAGDATKTTARGTRGDDDTGGMRPFPGLYSLVQEAEAATNAQQSNRLARIRAKEEEEEETAKMRRVRVDTKTFANAACKTWRVGGARRCGGGRENSIGF